MEQIREQGEAAEILFTGDHSHREQMQKAEANRNTAETAQKPQGGRKDKQAYFISQHLETPQNANTELAEGMRKN